MNGLYIHIPFCVSKCFYCNFVSFKTSATTQKKYIKELCAEIKNKKNLIKPKTLYIGGGTPSILTPALLEMLFKTIEKNFGPIKNFKESTLEANVESLTLAKLKLFKKYGFTRLSLGLQSPDNKYLKIIGRAHTWERFLKIYTIAKKYFENINIDLIANLPIQTLADFSDGVKKVISLKPKHISLYALEIESGCVLYQKGFSTDDDLCLKMLKTATTLLEKAGYTQYEISNFSQKGAQSKHNINYWKNGSYLGLGLAASSYLKGVRSTNTADLKKYLTAKNKTAFSEKLKGKAKEGEKIILALRMLDGFKPTKKMLQLFKEDFDSLIKQKLLISKQGKLALTEQGKYLANEVFRHFVEPF